MGTYFDKKREDIEKEVRRDFDKNDSFWIRDDQEIYNAGLATINKYKNEVLNSDRLVRKERYIMKDGKPVLFRYQNDYWKAARKYFTEAYNKIVDLHNNVTGWIKFTTDAEDDDLIRKVAIDIDNAENEALRKIEQYCNPMQEGDNASYHSSVKKDNQGTPVVRNGEIQRQKPMFTQDRTGLITFTDRCNSISFVNMANNSGLFYKKKGKYPQYTIDYTSCKNQKMKDKMYNLTGGYKGSLRYDATQKTYIIKGSNGTEIKALSIGIWEGVTFKRKEIEADEAHEKDQKRKETLGNVDIQVNGDVSPENDPELKKYVDDIPEKLRIELRRLGAKEYRKFIIETENRLATILREYKYYNYELHTNVVSNSSSGLFEINFISRDYERSAKLRENGNKDLGSALYSLFVVSYSQDPLSRPQGSRSFQSEYKKYLEKRIPAKWNEVDELASRENLIGVDYVRNPDLAEEEILSPEKLTSINYGIYLLKTFIQNHRNNEGNSYIDKDDRNLTGMLEDLQNLESTIQTDVSLVSKHTIFSIINDTALKLGDRWYRYTYGTQYKRFLYNDFKSIIMSDDNNVKFKTLRNLGYRSFGSDGTTAFLSDEISKSDVKETKFINENGEEENIFYAESRLEINDDELNERFHYINACLYTEIEFDGNGDLKRTVAMDRIDKLYNCCGDTSGRKIAEELYEMGILPESWVDDGDVLDKCKEIAEILQNKKKNINNNFSMDIVKKGVSDQKIKLESKYPRTKEEDNELEKLKYYDEHPDEAEVYYTASLECMKNTFMYYGINSEIGCLLAPVFVEEGGGAKGEMGEMYNDIIGYGFWDLSDKTAVVLQNVIISIVISCIAGIAISGIISLAGAYLLEHFPGLVKILEGIKTAISTRVSKFVASLGGIKGRLAKVGLEILKKYNAGLVGVRNTFINNFRAGIPLDGGFSLGHHTFDSILVMSIAYLSGVVGQFGHLFGEKISECFEKVFSKFGEHPEWGDNVASIAESITETASKEGLKSVKNLIFSSGDDDIVFESDFDSGLANLDNDIRSGEDKQKLSELVANSKIKFHLSTQIVDKTGRLTGRRNPVDALSLMTVVQNLLALKFVNYDNYMDYAKKIEEGKLKLHLGEIPGKVYVQDTNTGNFVSLSELSSGG